MTLKFIIYFWKKVQKCGNDVRTDLNMFQLYARKSMGCAQWPALSFILFIYLYFLFFYCFMLMPGCNYQGFLLDCVQIQELHPPKADFVGLLCHSVTPDAVQIQRLHRCPPGRPGPSKDQHLNLDTVLVLVKQHKPTVSSTFWSLKHCKTL